MERKKKTIANSPVASFRFDLHSFFLLLLLFLSFTIHFRIFLFFFFFCLFFTRCTFLRHRFHRTGLGSFRFFFFFHIFLTNFPFFFWASTLYWSFELVQRWIDYSKGIIIIFFYFFFSNPTAFNNEPLEQHVPWIDPLPSLPSFFFKGRRRKVAARPEPIRWRRIENELGNIQEAFSRGQTTSLTVSFIFYLFIYLFIYFLNP